MKKNEIVIILKIVLKYLLMQNKDDNILMTLQVVIALET